MDWEIFLGLAGLYIIAVASLYYQFTVSKRIIHLTSTVMEILTERRSLIMKKAQERAERENESREEK